MYSGNVDTEAADTEISWVTVAEMTRLMGVNRRKVYELINTGCFPAYKFGRTIRARKQDVMDFINASVINPGEISHLYEPVTRAPQNRAIHIQRNSG